MRATIELGTLGEMQAELARLVATSDAQRRAGLVPALSSVPSVRYRREPTGRERWQTAAETNRYGEGDCEDLAIWLAADATVRGIPARVVIRRIRSGLMHALCAMRIPRADGRGSRVVVIDPSKARGMGRH